MIGFASELLLLTPTTILYADTVRRQTTTSSNRSMELAGLVLCFTSVRARGAFFYPPTTNH